MNYETPSTRWDSQGTRGTAERGKKKSGDSFTETKGNEAMGRFQGRQKVVD